MILFFSLIEKRFSGKDATKAFTGGVYYHSNAARNTLIKYRIGTVAKDDNWAFGEVIFIILYYTILYYISFINLCIVSRVILH